MQLKSKGAIFSLSLHTELVILPASLYNTNNRLSKLLFDLWDLYKLMKTRLGYWINLRRFILYFIIVINHKLYMKSE